MFSEPDAGSDLASLTTKAERDGEVWRVNGRKVWTSAGHAADWGILMARTKSLADAPKHEGISFFLVDMHTPGIEFRPLRQMTGSAEFDEVTLDDVILPADALLGPEHAGWGVAMGALDARTRVHRRQRQSARARGWRRSSPTTRATTRSSATAA